MDEMKKKSNDTVNNDDLDIDSKLSDFLDESFKASKALDSIVGDEKKENVVASTDVTLTNIETRKPLEKQNLLNDKNTDNKVHNVEDESISNVSVNISKDSIISSTDEELTLDTDKITTNKMELSDKPDVKNEIKEKEPLSGADSNIKYENSKDTFSINDQKEKFNLNIDYSKSNINEQRNINRKPKGKNSKKKKVEVNYSIFTGLIVTVVVLVVSASLAFFGISLGLEYLGINKSDEVIKLNIKEGSNTNEIAQQLYDENIIDNMFLFKVIVNLKDAGALMKPGDIELKPNSSYADKIDALMEQRQSFENVSVVFPEGITLLDAAKLLETKGVISDYHELIRTFNSEKFGYDYESQIDSNSNKFYDMEGYFYPDTYNFYIDDSSYNIVKTVREHFNSKFTDEMKAKMSENGMNMNEVITLASIVQTEAGSVKDMPKVASVFLNRLKDPANFPRLESDATKSYYKEVIKVEAEISKTYTDSEIAEFKDSYDTYVANGLPSGPVCNPGLEAINAVLYPAKTDYLYFCSNIKTKKTYFAKTLSKHKENLKKAGLSD